MVIVETKATIECRRTEVQAGLGMVNKLEKTNMGLILQLTGIAPNFSHFSSQLSSLGQMIPFGEMHRYAIHICQPTKVRDTVLDDFNPKYLVDYAQRTIKFHVTWILGIQKVK